MAISVPPFRCHHAALTPDQVSRLREEAHALFTAKQKTRGSGRYSAGTTFFIHAADTPRSLAEEYALSVFRWFTQGQYFDPHCAGAEFWPLVLNENSDEVGAHYDKDYAAEAEGEDLYPLVGTVTYLADHGAPTTFFEITEDTTRDHSECSIEHAWISRVRSGKVVAFDGRYLHCAPSALIDMWGRGPAQATPRVTMLVNIWFDPPRDAIRSPFIDESYTPTNPFPAHLGAPDPLPCLTMTEGMEVTIDMGDPKSCIEGVVDTFAVIGTKASCVELVWPPNAPCRIHKKRKKEKKQNKKSKRR